MVASILTMLMVALGFLAVIFAFEVIGNPQKGDGKKALLRIHRILGYCFLTLFLSIFIMMAMRFKNGIHFTTKAEIHIALAATAAVVLIIKLLVARRYKKFASNLFIFGCLLIVLTMGSVVNVVGSHFGKGLRVAGIERIEKTPIEIQKKKVENKLLPVEEKFILLCGQCHPIGSSIYAISEKKGKQHLAELVERMRLKTDTISIADAKEIVDYMAQFE